MKQILLILALPFFAQDQKDSKIFLNKKQLSTEMIIKIKKILKNNSKS